MKIDGTSGRVELAKSIGNLTYSKSLIQRSNYFSILYAFQSGLAFSLGNRTDFSFVIVSESLGSCRLYYRSIRKKNVYVEMFIIDKTN